MMNLLLVSRQFAYDVKDIFFSTATFRIDIRRDGTFMCGRRLLEPTRADGTSHVHLDETTAVKDRFLSSFDWKAVKNYSVEILLENWAAPQTRAPHSLWDEEVEIYDIRGQFPIDGGWSLSMLIQTRLCIGRSVRYSS